MDVVTPSPPQSEPDPKLELESDVERTRGEREDLERQIASDRDMLTQIRTALDSMIAAVWRDVAGQLQSMRGRDNVTAALTFEWAGGYQWFGVIGMVAVAAGAIVFFQVGGGVAAAGFYAVLACAGYFVARDRALAPLRKARSSYLGDDGKDIRFVAFTHLEPSLQHPLIGFDGPLDGQIEDRAWKIPGIRERDAVSETFVEVIDDRRSNVLLTRFPERKPTLVHADLENPFVRSYGVFLQRALERSLPAVATQAEEFRAIVAHHGARRALDEKLRKLEGELHEFDGTAAILRALPLPAALRNKLLRQVVLFRLGDPSVQRGLLLLVGDRVDRLELMQTMARAAAATLLRLSFAQIKIGYVGQGAAAVSRLFDTARRTRSIVFVDEAERFFSSGGSAAYESMRREVVQAILKEWENVADRGDVWIVAAATARDGLDEGVVARFGTIVDCDPSANDRDMTVVIDTKADVPDADVVLAEPVQARIRLLAAMFAHAATMESQGIAVPRAVLIAGGTAGARRTVVQALVEQTALPALDAVVDDVDQAMLLARDRERALVALDIPEYADPGSLAHLAVLIDELSANKAPLFILALVPDEAALDPELRARFPETIDLSELDGAARRFKLAAWLAERVLAFPLEAALDELESQTDGMTEEALRHFVDDAVRKAALRAIDQGDPARVVVAREDFEPGARAATKDDEAAL